MILSLATMSVKVPEYENEGRKKIGRRDENQKRRVLRKKMERYCTKAYFDLAYQGWFPGSQNMAHYT